MLLRHDGGGEHPDRAVLVLEGPPQGGHQGRCIALGDEAERIEFFDLCSLDHDVKQGANDVRMLET